MKLQRKNAGGRKSEQHPHHPQLKPSPVQSAIGSAHVQGPVIMCVFVLVCVRSLVTSIFLYTCESWTLTVELQRRIQAMEMRCYRKILRVSYKDHVTSEEVRAEIHQAI